ncbi:hypothetical protein [Kingella potus]|uniref:hypothetical protein n=1 Tax=Kingella potus TaxID=265175 RepID=UPI001FD36DDA|nr:hypothetical protein [Kingella potus]UOO99929.1 hypothetical protein LVJ84_07625 [Kingella potus]
MPPQGDVRVHAIASRPSEIEKRHFKHSISLLSNGFVLHCPTHRANSRNRVRRYATHPTQRQRPSENLIFRRPLFVYL